MIIAWATPRHVHALSLLFSHSLSASAHPKNPMKFGGFMPIPPAPNLRMCRRHVVSVDPLHPHQSARQGSFFAACMIGQSLETFLPFATARICFFLALGVSWPFWRIPCPVRFIAALLPFHAYRGLSVEPLALDSRVPSDPCILSSALPPCGG